MRRIVLARFRWRYTKRNPNSASTASVVSAQTAVKISDMRSTSRIGAAAALGLARGAGLSVVQVIIEGIHPPAEVANVYQMVISASIDKNTIIIEAETAAERKLIDADRQSRSIVNYAQARQYYRVSAAMQEMAVFHAAMEAHTMNSESFELARYLDVFERVIESSTVHVFSPGMEGSMHRSVVGQPNTPGIMGF